VYPEPEVFNPGRFINPDGSLRDDSTLVSVYGFGRRICPGRYFVDATLFIVAVTVLSVFRIDKRPNSSGEPFQFTYTGGLVRCVGIFLKDQGSANPYILIQSPEPVPMLYQSEG